MASNILSASIDLSTLFASRISTAIANVGYKTAGVDISGSFEPLGRDQQIPTIGIKALGVDISTKFMGNVSQYSSTARDTSTRSTGWHVLLIHEEQIDFTSATARTNFFLYGGRIIWSGSRTGGSVNTKNTDWTNLLSSMGTVELGKTGSYRNVNTVLNGVGSDTLTGSVQTLYTASGTGAYASNSITVQAYQTSTTSIRIRTTLNDAATGTVDETIDGTLTGTIGERRHPSQTAPTYTAITLLTSGT